MEPTQKTIADNIEDRSKDNMNIPAFESLGGSIIDYKTFFDAVNVYAKSFKEMGVQNGDIVTICSAGTLDTVINFFALNKIGAVAQFVNPNYFKYNAKKYINDTNSKLLICLDRFYPLIKDAISQTNVENIVLSSISEYSSILFKILARRKNISKSDRIDGINYIELPDFIKMGEKSSIKLEKIPYIPNKPSVITYTSGTTGNPKGVVHTNDSINNMINIYEMADGIGAKEGYRNLVLIPPMYLTSLVHEIITPMSLGATNIMQPIYNPNTFAEDLKKYEPQATVGSKAHYLGLEKGKYKKGAFDYVKLAYCGGEAISRTVAIRINDVLDYYGIPPLIIGYGQTELGTMCMFNYGLEDRTNESGILLPGVEAKILDYNGNPVEKGERGELYIKSPAVMVEYINNEEDTEKFFITDENGEKWARTGDIAEIERQYEGQDVYNVSGRKKDSFVDKDGKVVYLFDIEPKIEEIKYVSQAEVVAVTIDGNKVPVVHIVLDNHIKSNYDDVIRIIHATLKNSLDNPNSIPYAYKIRDSFEVSPISGKRNYEILQYESEGFLKVDDYGNVHSINLDSEESKQDNNLLQSNIMLR